MARLSFALLALFAVVVAATATAEPNNPPPPGHDGHHMREWVHQKGAQLKQWGHQEKAKLAAWKASVVPKIRAAKAKFGAQWQQKAPLVVAALKKEAGIYFNKAVEFVNKKLQG
ncbi:hypothetical protein FOCC_FOCC001515 [Frankliniella occidentalis]|nr:hypothetical protein FOCC_FOCC001515 [Frankliniella occidentalis]